ncbi:MAG: type I methionyl aminopeptidase [Pelagibacterales bacterium]|nr:type I methionyl aminopeptidase [Pelagibacterales bacterium]
MMILKSIEEIRKIRESALIVSKTLGMLANEIRPGITSLYLDNLAETFILDNLCKPGFKGYNGFPNTLCISINEQVVHGIPNDIPLKDGDIVSIDCGVIKDGFYGDHAYTFKVGNVEKDLENLLEITKKSLYVGIESLIVGNKVGDIGNSIQNFISKHGYGIVKELVGHGLGKNLHEDPEIPNYGKKDSGLFLKEGMVVAIEPMINLGTEKVNQLDDGWTIVTLDGKPSAHFEHNIAIIDGKPEVLSTFNYIYDALGIESNEEDKFKSYFD